MPRMIFHYPGKLSGELDSGEKKRPVKMLQAFRSLGYDVTEITGSLGERRSALRRLASSSEKHGLLYSENSTMPLRLCTETRFPCLLQNPDFGVFELAARRGVPSGVFYRDIYWRYPHFRRELGALKYYAALPFYHEELNFYLRRAGRIFVPSERFAPVLAGGSPSLAGRFEPLFPAEDPHPETSPAGKASGDLRILYVGALRPPVYGAGVFIETAVSHGEGVTLDIVTRKNEAVFLPPSALKCPRIKVHHVSGAALEELYRAADVFAMFFEDDAYRRICMPVKFFEALGFGLPVISSENNAAADFVLANGNGWVCGGADLPALLRRLVSDQNELALKKEKARALGACHTWEKRAAKAAETILRQSERNA